MSEVVCGYPSVLSSQLGSELTPHLSSRVLPPWILRAWHKSGLWLPPLVRHHAVNDCILGGVPPLLGWACLGPQPGAGAALLLPGGLLGLWMLVRLGPGILTPLLSPAPSLAGAAGCIRPACLVFVFSWLSCRWHLRSL